VTFTAIFEPDDGGWCVRIPSVAGCHSEGRSLNEARKNIREALATCVDVFGSEAEADRVAETAEIVEDVRLPAGAKRALARVIASRRDAEARAAKAQQELAATAKTLTRKLGLSLRDTGALLGVSHERVKQLLEKQVA
jgi:predicted RNase H-like HicB family nuclease